MELDDVIVNLKVKIYYTKSSFDVQGLKSHFDTVFEVFGNRTIVVYFVLVILEAIFQSILNDCDLDEFNEHCKRQLKLGVENVSKVINQNTDKKGEKSKKDRI